MEERVILLFAPETVIIIYLTIIFTILVYLRIKQFVENRHHKRMDDYDQQQSAIAKLNTENYHLVITLREKEQKYSQQIISIKADHDQEKILLEQKINSLNRLREDDKHFSHIAAVRISALEAEIKCLREFSIPQGQAI